MDSFLRARIFLVLMMSLLVIACDQRTLEYRQVYSGTKGPDTTTSNYYPDAASVEASWVRTALTAEEYGELVKRIDFSRQVLLAFSTSEIVSFSGKVWVVDVYQYTGVDTRPMNARIRVGVKGAACRDNIKATPFVLAIIERPKDFQKDLSSGFDVSYFDDGCRA